ncbi:MAG: hypothetical protein D9V47_03445 [Clostridia bacterium]|nr:MAG: hypothetical protein D9V47_03445 [Clostridia bacterium]
MPPAPTKPITAGEGRSKTASKNPVSIVTTLRPHLTLRPTPIIRGRGKVIKLHRFSVPWVLAIHIPVPATVALGLGIDWAWPTFPPLAGAFFLRQLCGARLKRRPASTRRSPRLRPEEDPAATGRRDEERRKVRLIVPLLVVLFLAGAAFAYFVVFRFAARFLILVAGPDLQPMISIVRVDISHLPRGPRTSQF